MFNDYTLIRLANQTHQSRLAVARADGLARELIRTERGAKRQARRQASEARITAGAMSEAGRSSSGQQGPTSIRRYRTAGGHR